MKSEICRLCGAEAHPSFRQELMGKMDVQYFSCPTCGYFQTQKPFWLDRAYQSAINDLDTGLIERNAFLADFLSAFFVFRRRAHFLDFAGGYGLLVRLMRNYGYRFFWGDAHCQNIFAKEFEWERFAAALQQKVNFVTAFEVLEHASEPKEMIAQMLACGAEGIVFSTQLFQGTEPDEKWWYLGVEHGQHIGFFNQKSLAFLGRHFGLKLISFRGLHYFSKKSSSRVWFVFCVFLAHLCVPRVMSKIWK